MSASLDASFLDGIKEDQTAATPVEQLFFGEVVIRILYFALKIQKDGGFEGDQSTCLNNKYLQRTWRVIFPHLLGNMIISMFFLVPEKPETSKILNMKQTILQGLQDVC